MPASVSSAGGKVFYEKQTRIDQTGSTTNTSDTTVITLSLIHARLNSFTLSAWTDDASNTISVYYVIVFDDGTQWQSETYTTSATSETQLDSYTAPFGACFPGSIKSIEVHAWVSNAGVPGATANVHIVLDVSEFIEG